MILNKKWHAQLSLLHNRSFILFMSGTAISKFGDNMQRFALSLYVLNQTHSSLQFSLVLMCAAIPQALIQPFAGVFADMLNRKHIMVFFDLLSALVTSLFVGIFLFSISVPISAIYILVFILSISAAAESPAANAALPSFINKEQYIVASSVDSSISTICNIGAPMIVTLLYGLFGVLSVSLFNAISFLISAICKSALVIPHSKSNNKITPFTFFNNLGEGINFVKNDSFMTAMLFLILMLNLSISSITIGLPIIIKVTLGATDLQFSFINSFASASMLISPFIASFLYKKVVPEYFMIAASGLIGLFCVIFGLIPLFG